MSKGIKKSKYIIVSQADTPGEVDGYINVGYVPWGAPFSNEGKIFQGMILREVIDNGFSLDKQIIPRASWGIKEKGKEKLWDGLC